MLDHEDRVQVARLMGEHFSDGELRDICFELPGLDYDDLPGDTRKGKIRELVKYAKRHGLEDDLMTLLREARPKVDWPGQAPPAPPLVDPAGVAPELDRPAIPDSPPDIPFAQRAELLDKLVACRSLADKSRRDTLVRNLPSEMRNGITRDNAADIDISNILEACLAYPGGLAEFIMILRYYERNTLQMQDVDRVLRDLFE